MRLGQKTLRKRERAREGTAAGSTLPWQWMGRISSNAACAKLKKQTASWHMFGKSDLHGCCNGTSIRPRAEFVIVKTSARLRDYERRCKGSGKTATRRRFFGTFWDQKVSLRLPTLQASQGFPHHLVSSVQGLL